MSRALLCKAGRMAALMPRDGYKDEISEHAYSTKASVSAVGVIRLVGRLMVLGMGRNAGYGSGAGLPWVGGPGGRLVFMWSRSAHRRLLWSWRNRRSWRREVAFGRSSSGAWRDRGKTVTLGGAGVGRQIFGDRHSPSLQATLECGLAL